MQAGNARSFLTKRKMKTNFETLRFLVIDDSGFVRRMMCEALNAHGVQQIVEATDAVEGLKVLQDKSQTIDFILVDQEMPVLDGLDFTRLVRKDKTLPNPSVPIIMVTALANKTLVVDSYKAGVDAFVAKPFSPDQLGEHIQVVLDNKSPKNPAQDAKSVGANRLKNLTVLLIDDSGVARKIAKRVLAEINITRVLEAEDGASAITLLKERSNEIGLILVDREMPVIDGLEFTEMVRNSQSGNFADMPIIMISALSEEDQIIEAREAGVTSFVAKPYKPQELKVQIQFAIRDARPFKKQPETGEIELGWG